MLTLLAPETGRADPAIDCIEQEFLGLINQYRAENGRGPLALNTPLSAAADWMSGDLGLNRYFSHTDSLGRNPSQRAAAFGYGGGVGENIAAGYSSAQSVFNGWKSSPGHNANMLGSNYKVIGIGRVQVPGSPYGVYWTTDFGLAANAPGAPGPAVSCGNTPAPTGVPTATPAATPTAVPTPPPTSTPTAPPATPTPTPTAKPTASPSPAPTAPPSVFGDVDCNLQISSADALEVLRLVALIGQQPECQANADVNCDGQVSSVDALEILAYIVSTPHERRAGCPPIGGTA